MWALLLKSFIAALIRFSSLAKRLDNALEQFRKREATASKAARSAGVPLTEFLDILKHEGLEFHYSAEDLKEEFSGL